MINLGPHAGFILWSYGIVISTLTALIGWLILDEKRQRKMLEDLENQGITRRSARKAAGR